MKSKFKSKILVVDDEPIARATIQALLGDGNYEIFMAENGADGVRLAADVQPDVILLDVMMPNMDGFEACRKIRSMPDLAEVPILLLTALDDQRSKMTGLRSGADDFVVKPFNVLELQIRVQNMTRLNRYRMLLEQRHELERLHEELTIAYDRTIEGWSQAVDLRDRETEEHTERVVRMVLYLAQAVRMSDEQMIHIRRGAILHDVGKLAVPDSILQKPGPLSADEWVIMKRHTSLAYEWLSKIAYLLPAVDIPYCHHEKWDGSGYPRGLKGDEIPLSARLFAIADVWDAMTSARPYHPAMKREVVLAYIQSQRGKHFDPAVVDLFLSTDLANVTDEDLLASDKAHAGK